MKKIWKILLIVGGIILLLLLFALLSFVWWRYVPVTDGEYTIENAHITWNFTVKDGVLQTTSIVNKDENIQLPVSGDDFRVRVGPASSIGYVTEKRNGKKIIDYIIRENRWITPADCVCKWLIRSPGTRTLVCEDVNSDVIIKLHFDISEDTPWLKRTLSLQAIGDTHMAVDRADHVQWHTARRMRLGGRGQPVFVDDAWFVALEHPNSSNICENGTLTLRQFPGYRFGKEGVTLQTMVIGGSAPARIDEAMDAYVDGFRRPPRAISLYNTWCDMRTDKLTAKNIIDTAYTLKKRLEPYNSQFDYFVIDDGWQNKMSIWQPLKSRFPDGLAPVFESLRNLDYKGGLWLPLTGVMLDIKWGEARDYEAACGQYYCLSGTNYNRALRKRVREIQKTCQISFFKHDFNYFNCTRVQHGHFASYMQSSEANVDALCKLLEEETATNPNILLAVTSGLWPSPWWLKYCDIIWMGGKDHDFDYTLPASRGSAAEMNYRDGALYKICKEDGMVFPLSSFMTHGVVDARHTVYDIAAEDNEGWANYVMNYLGRGTLLREFYISPEKLTPLRWKILARALAWARSLNNCMKNSAFILGDPRKGELFGYAGADENTSYLSLRNPSLFGTNIAAHDLGVVGQLCEVVYPYHEFFIPRIDTTFTIPGETVWQTVNTSRENIPLPVPLGIRSTLLTGSYNTTQYRVYHPPGFSGSFTVESPVPIDNIVCEGAHASRISHTQWDVDLISGNHSGNEDVQVNDIHGNSKGVISTSITIPSHITAELHCILTTQNEIPVSATVNGEKVLLQITRGDNWQLLTMPVQSGKNNIAIQCGDSLDERTYSADIVLSCNEELESHVLTIQHGTIPMTTDTTDNPVPLLHTTRRFTIPIARKLQFKETL